MEQLQEQRENGSAEQRPFLGEAERADIQRLLRRLPRRHPLRPCILALLEEMPLPVEIPELLHAAPRSSGSRWEERALAAWALGLMPARCSAYTEKLCEILENRQQTLSERLAPSSLRALFATLSLAAVPALLIGSDIAGKQGHPSPALILSIALILALTPTLYPIVFLLTVPLSYALQVMRTNRVRALAALSLGRLCDPQSLGVLAGAAAEGGGMVRRNAISALRRLLPLLSPEHYGRIGPLAVPNLCRLLSHPRERFVLEILAALGKVGDGRAVPAVEWIAEQGETVWLQEAAQRILPLLRQRLQQESAPRTLLRATCLPDPAPESLLRPATGTQDAKIRLLLRATPIQPSPSASSVYLLQGSQAAEMKPPVRYAH